MITQAISNISFMTRSHVALGTNQVKMEKVEPFTRSVKTFLHVDLHRDHRRNRCCTEVVVWGLYFQGSRSNLLVVNHTKSIYPKLQLKNNTTTVRWHNFDSFNNLVMLQNGLLSFVIYLILKEVAHSLYYCRDGL